MKTIKGISGYNLNVMFIFKPSEFQENKLVEICEA